MGNYTLISSLLLEHLEGTFVFADTHTHLTLLAAVWLRGLKVEPCGFPTLF